MNLDDKLKLDKKFISINNVIHLSILTKLIYLHIFLAK